MSNILLLPTNERMLLTAPGINQASIIANVLKLLTNWKSNLTTGHSKAVLCSRSEGYN